MKSFGRGADRQAAQDVVGFVAGILEKRNPVGPEDFLQLGELDDQIVGHGFSVGFVIPIDFLPDFGPGGVENDSDVVGAGVVQDFSQGGQESVDGVGRESAGGGKSLDGIVRPVKQRRSIDQIERFSLHSLIRFFCYGFLKKSP